MQPFFISGSGLRRGYIPGQSWDTPIKHPAVQGHGWPTAIIRSAKMTNLPDYVSWASMETLSPHAIACLTLGVTPPSREPRNVGRKGSPPPLPSEAGVMIDSAEWQQDYERVFLPLRSGIDSGQLVCQTKNGEPTVTDAIQYLKHVAETNNWLGWLEDVEFYKVVSRQGSCAIAALELQIICLEEEIREKSEALAKCQTAGLGTYTNTNLVWLRRAINELFDEYPERCPTTDHVTKWIVDESARENQPVSRTSAKRIAVILTPDERKTGGRRPRK